MKTNIFLIMCCVFLLVVARSIVYAEEQNKADQQIDQGIGVSRNGVIHASAAEASALIDKNPNLEILDVRTGWEYKRGHIKGATSLNYYWFGFEEKLSTLDKQATWLVHCKSGVRSANTLPMMIKAGFTSIIHLDGGIDDWRKAGFPTVQLNGY